MKLYSPGDIDNNRKMIIVYTPRGIQLHVYVIFNTPRVIQLHLFVIFHTTGYTVLYETNEAVFPWVC
jgi:hypothetical protein